MHNNKQKTEKTVQAEKQTKIAHLTQCLPNTCGKYTFTNVRNTALNKAMNRYNGLK